LPAARLVELIVCGARDDVADADVRFAAINGGSQ
jgi:hypothetical protein